SIVTTKDPTTATAGAHGHNQTRFRGGLVCFSERTLHISGDGSCYQKHIRMTGRSHKANSQAFGIIHRTIQASDLDLAPVARSGIHFSDLQGPAKYSMNFPLQFSFHNLL